MVRRVASMIVAVVALAASAQPQVDTSTRVFDSSFRSLKVAVEGNDYVAPVILLGGDGRIRIEFDQISPEMQYLRYSVTHCDADWQPSMLVDSEY
ncbi:MAG: type IX secretion system plug protein domain-containing protein, partial [Candidatus Limisoma sp.]